MTDVGYGPAAHYDRVTAAWTLLLGEDLHYGVFGREAADLPSATGALTRLMIEAAELEAGLEMLDVGCGTGAPACQLARDEGVRVTGITTSAIGIERATARAESEGLADFVTFKKRDGMDNGFPDASVDRVWALESSHLMRERDRLVSECARVLRPGGRFALCDIVLQRPLSLAEVRRLRKPLALLRDVFGDARMEPLGRYGELASSAGLRVDTVRDLTAETRPTFGCWRENAAKHHGEAAELIGERDLERFVESCDVLEAFWDDGTLGYGLIAASMS